MNFAEFQRILTSFADTKADFDAVRGRLVAQVRGELIEATIKLRDGELVVDDDLAMSTPARRWLVTRVARLPQLAARIADTLEVPTPFVRPSGLLEDFAERAEGQVTIPDAAAEIYRMLDWRPGGTTSILYVTSDAGEGKTTAINHLAKAQAQAYTRKDTDWLLVPITLGGRTFMRFDDIVIAELVNRFRFPFFYYDGFLELVKLGAIVPAFDGFEEMFVEGSTGEALSALGTLLRSLGSTGSVLIAARKAYFEFRSIATRTQLFDVISGNAVAFARMKLCRWSRQQFLSYSAERGYSEPEKLYTAVADRLGRDHAVLTRAVLVKRLLDVAESHESLEGLLGALGHAPADYFHDFVETILVREVNEKWIDRQGEAARPLLTVAQHEELLGLVAQEMWLSSSEVLRQETLDVIADLFCESHRLSAAQTHQVKERLPQHSLLTSADQGRGQIAFDHEDFRKYFLGEALGRALVTTGAAGLRSLLRVGSLPSDTCDSVARHVVRAHGDIPAVVHTLVEVGSAELPTSFTRENCGALIIRLLDGLDVSCQVGDITFPPDALNGRHLVSHTFVQCYWPATTLEGAQLLATRFERCRFEALEISSTTKVSGAELALCEIQSVSREEGGVRTFDPHLIRQLLSQAGFRLGDEAVSTSDTSEVSLDEECALVERMLRTFLRSTQANEETFRRRFGTRSNYFMDEVLPRLIRGGIVQEVQYAGSGQQRRFRLAIPMRVAEEALAQSGGSFSRFLGSIHLLPRPASTRA